VERCLEEDGRIEEIAKHFFKSSDFLYLAGAEFPRCSEERSNSRKYSYIHAEGYPPER